MSEKEVRDLGNRLVQRQIDLAKLKADRGKISEVVNLEAEIVNMKRDFNNGLAKLSKEQKVIVVGTE